jgi:general secretion pathway protein A
MYLSFFRLKEFPFNLTPDPRFLFMSRSHREAFDHLLYGIHQRHGFVEVVGGIGTGKTTLCRALLEELRGKVPTALIFNTFLSESELLRTINEEFEIDASGTTRKQLVDTLNGFLIDQLARGGNACLIIDECQNLRVPLLEQIRMLSNLETENVKLLQIVLVGQPEFHKMLKSPQLKQLDERINVRSFLGSLDEEDTRAYIEHRLTVAGSRGDIQFTAGATKRIYDYSRGIPRRINMVCDRCLLIAYSRETYRITDKHVKLAVMEIQGANRISTASVYTPGRQGWPVVLWCLMSLLGLIGFAGGWLFGQSLIQRSLQHSPTHMPSSTSVLQDSEAQQQAPEASQRSKITGTASSLPTPPRFFRGFSTVTPPPEGYRLQDGGRYAGMDVTRLTPSKEKLLRFRRPCLMVFKSEDSASPKYGVLRGISEKGVWIQEGNPGLKLIPQQELAQSWLGEVWVFLSTAGRNDELKAQARGGEVIRLQTDLARLGYWNGEPTGLYDLNTVHAVMAFQKDMHLAANGRVGPRSRAMMIQLLGDGEMGQ